MKNIYFTLLFTCLMGQILGQNITDLLYQKDRQIGKEKVETLLKISKIYRKKEPQKAKFYAKKALTETQKIKDDYLLSTSYLYLANALREQYNYTIEYKANEGELLVDICKRFGVTRAGLESHNYYVKDTIGYYGKDLTIASSLRFIQPLVFNQVCAYYEKTLELRRTLNQSNRLIFALKTVGDFYLSEKELEKAEKLYLEWVDVRRQQKNSTKLVWALRYLADFYHENKQPSKSAKLYDEIITIDKTRKNRNGFANTLGEICWIYPDPIQADRYFNQALQIWLEEKNEGKIYWMRQRKIQRKIYISDRTEKEKYLKQQLAFSQTLMDTILVEDALKDLVYFYLAGDNFNHTQFEQYMDSLWNFLEKTQRLDVMEYKNDIIDRLGRNVYAKNWKDEWKVGTILPYLYRYKTHYEINAPNAERMETIYQNLQSYHQKMAHYDSVAFYFKKRNQEYLKPQTDGWAKTYQVDALDDLAFYYQKAKDYSQALRYFNQALTAQKASQNPIWIAEQLNKIGYLYQQKMDSYYQQAWRQVKRLKPSEIEENMTRSHRLAFQFWRIANLYQTNGKTKKALAFMQKSFELMTLVEQIKFSNKQRGGHGYRYDYSYPKGYPQLHEFEKSLEKLKKNEEVRPYKFMILLIKFVF